MTALEFEPSVKFAVPHPVWVRTLVFPSEQVALQDPVVGQLHPALHETDEGEKSQVTPDTLFVTLSVPPFMFRLARATPVTVIGLCVVVVKSNSTEPEGAVKTRLIPSLVKLKTLFTPDPEFQVRRCPVLPDFVTERVAPLRPATVKFGTRVRVSEIADRTQFELPPPQVRVTVPEKVADPTVHPEKFLVTPLPEHVEKELPSQFCA